MAKKAPWMPFYGFDFYSDRYVRSMDIAQEGAYLRLLWSAWTEGGIPSDLDELCTMLEPIKPREFERVWKKVGRCWHVHPDDPSLLINNRQEVERSKKAEVIEKRRAAGRKGGRPKKAEEPNG